MTDRAVDARSVKEVIEDAIYRGLDLDKNPADFVLAALAAEGIVLWRADHFPEEGVR